MIRLVFGIILIGLAFLVLNRKRISGRRRSTLPELSMPFCPKCESNRRIIANSGEVFLKTEYPWFCLTCQEHF